MLLYWVVLTANENIYFVIPASSEEEAFTKAAGLVGDGWASPVFKIRKTEEQHWCVGQRFRGMEGVYTCTSYDARQGFWMENETDKGDRRNVSERAPGRTYHRIYSEVA